jgi:hypothetical protein
LKEVGNDKQNLVGGGLGGYSNSSMEKAVRIALGAAVDFIVTKTPEKFYHYQPGVHFGAFRFGKPDSLQGEPGFFPSC